MSAALEAAAVALGLTYLLLAVREQRLCWVAGGASSLLFLWLFQRAALPAQALLQGYYVAVAVHGWWHWGAADGDGAALAIRHWNARKHALALAALLLLTALSLALREAPGTVALLDTAIGWGSVLATWMVARKVLENWLYWIVIDSAAALLYLYSALPATAALYLLYTLIAVHGWRRWRLQYLRSSAA